MISSLRRSSLSAKLLTSLIILGVLFIAAYLGLHPSRRLLMLIIVAMGGLALLRQPRLGLLALVLTALAVPLEFGTGTEVSLNAATLLVPSILFLWLLDMILRRELRLVPSGANLPLLLFLLAGLLSLLVGNVLWDPSVPRPGHFIWVQLSQWSVFAFSAGAFWLTANWMQDEAWLRRLTFVFLFVGGGLAVLRLLPGFGAFVSRFTTVAFIRAPFWVLLASLAGGQLLFNHELSPGWRLYLWVLLLAIGFYSFILQRRAASNWVGVAAVAGTLIWLRWPRLRWLVVGLLVILTAIGILFPAVYQFAGGDEEWFRAGGSRLALIQRVLEVTLRNPITGLGPASYRAYANIKPLVYANIVWLDPRVSSHNNYIDLVAHTGLLGFGLFLWFAGELVMTGWRLCGRLQKGFVGGYAAAMLAAWVGALVLMLLADWILPFVYNIGFPGFQASLLVWLFLGGLVALENGLFCSSER